MPPLTTSIHRIIIATLLTLFTVCASAQSTHVTLFGKTINQSNGEPIPYASISVIGLPIGTVANVQGAFMLKIPATHSNDSLSITAVGYQSVRLAISAIKRQQLVIRLKTATVVLDEVQVLASRKSAVDILKEAVAAIPHNYDTTSVQLTAFYREDTQFGAVPVSSNEAEIGRAHV